MTTESKIITVDNQPYDLATLGDDARKHLFQLQVIDVEMNRLQALAGVYQTARLAYIKSFKECARPTDEAV